MNFKITDKVKVVSLIELSKPNFYGNPEDTYEFLDEEALVVFTEGDNVYLDFINHRLNRLSERLDYVFKKEELELAN